MGPIGETVLYIKDVLTQGCPLTVMFICLIPVQEMVLSLVVQLIGVMLYGYCLGVIAATITNTSSSK